MKKPIFQFKKTPFVDTIEVITHILDAVNYFLQALSRFNIKERTNLYYLLEDFDYRCKDLLFKEKIVFYQHQLFNTSNSYKVVLLGIQYNLQLHLKQYRWDYRWDEKMCYDKSSQFLKLYGSNHLIILTTIPQIEYGLKMGWIDSIIKTRCRKYREIRL